MNKLVYKDYWYRDINKLLDSINSLKEEYNVFLKNLSKNKENALSNQFDIYNLKSCLALQRNKQKEIVIRVLKEYEMFKFIPCVIFLSGSLSRASNRFNSDIDLTFLYPEKFFNLINPIEEEIAVFLAKIFQFSGRDRVHTMTIYLPMNANEITEFDNRIEFLISNNKIDINCRDNSPRDFEQFKKHLSNNIKIDKCDEWIYNFEILYNNYKEYDIISIINKLDSKILEDDKYMLETLNLLEKIYGQLSLEEQENVCDYVKICRIKHLYKSEVLKNIYDFLAILRRLVLNDGRKIGLINFEEYYNNKDIDEILKPYTNDFWNTVYKYLWLLMRLESILNELGYELSSHEIREISISKIENIYYDRYKEHDIFNRLEIEKKNTYKCLKMIIDKILLNRR